MCKTEITKVTGNWRRVERVEGIRLFMTTLGQSLKPHIKKKKKSYIMYNIMYNLIDETCR